MGTFPFISSGVVLCVVSHTWVLLANNHFLIGRSYVSPGLQCSALPVDGVLQLLEGEEDEDGGGLETRPRGEPALEHEHRAFFGQRATDHPER
jgi:hypothetical protein